MARSKTLYDLTPEHRAELQPWADKWIANAMSTKAMTEHDRDVCRDAVVRLYAAAGKPPPKHIVFVPSPFVLAFAGGFSSEDGIFKALALGAPFVKAICMGRALMIPGMVGKNIQKWIEEKSLPRTVSEFGTSPEEIFVCWERVAEIVGKEEVRKIPLGAIGIYSYSDKLRVGLQQLMAGTRNWEVKYISRQDLFALSEECAKVTGIPYVMEAFRDEALAIIDA